MTSRKAGEGFGFGTEEAAEWIWDNRLGGGGEINAVGNIEGSKVESNNP